MSTIVLRYDGTDITNSVEYERATFEMVANGIPGKCSFVVKDADHSHSFTTGKELTLDIDGVRVWGGFVFTVSRIYPFDVEDTRNPAAAPRLWRIEGYDYNVLLGKRIVYDHGNRANELATFPTGTSDVTVVTYLLDTVSDIGADGVTHSGIVAVTSPYPDQPGRSAVAGSKLGDALNVTNQNVNAIFYIDPTKNFHWHDADTPTSIYTLTDHPIGPNDRGVRDLSILYSASDMANDVLVWGAGSGSTTGTPTFSRAQDATSIATHGRWQYATFVGGIYHQDKLDEFASRRLNGTPQTHRGLKDDKISWKATLFEPVLFLGDNVTVRSNVFGLTQVIPIRRLTITFPTPTDAKFDLVLSHERDQPWSFYEFLGFRTDITIHIPPRIDFQHCPAPAAYGQLAIFTDNFRAWATPHNPLGGYWGNLTGYIGDYPLTDDNITRIYPSASAATGYTAAIDNYAILDYPTGPPWEVLIAAEVGPDKPFVFYNRNLAFYLWPAVAGSRDYMQIGIDYYSRNEITHETIGSYNQTHRTATTALVPRGSVYIRIGIDPDLGVYARVWNQNVTEGYAKSVTIPSPIGETYSYIYPPTTPPQTATIVGMYSGYLEYPHFTGTIAAITMFGHGTLNVPDRLLDPRRYDAGRSWQGHWRYDVDGSDGGVYFYDGGYVEHYGFRPGSFVYDAYGNSGIPVGYSRYDGGNATKSSDLWTAVNPQVTDAYEWVYVTFMPFRRPEFFNVSGWIYASWPGTVLELVCFPTADNATDLSSNPPPFPSYDSFLGVVLGYVYYDGDPVYFSVDIPTAYFRDYIRWGFRTHSIVETLMAGPNEPRGAAGTIRIGAAGIYPFDYRLKWATPNILIPPFCVSSGGTPTAKSCETLNPEPANNFSWSSTVSQPYRPGSLEVWVDGMRLRTGDYLESPATGRFTIYGDLHDVNFVRVCYWPLT